MAKLQQWKTIDAWRQIYALVFAESKACYIGQTMNLKSRLLQHKRAFPEPFEAHVLGGIYGHYGTAQVEEWAWRYACHTQGWTVYSAPGKPIDPAQMEEYTFGWVKEHAAAKGMRGPYPVEAPNVLQTPLKPISMEWVCGGNVGKGGKRKNFRLKPEQMLDTPISSFILFSVNTRNEKPDQ